LDGKIHLWSIEKRELINSYSYGKPVLFAKFFFSSSKVIFSADSSIYFYDFDSPSSFRKIASSSALIRAIDVSQKNKLTAFGSYSGEIVLLDSNLNELKKFSLGRQIYSVKFSKSGNLLAVGDYEGIVTIMDINLCEKVAEFATNRDDSYKNVVWSVAFSPDDSLVIAGGIDGKSRIYNLKTKELQYSFPSHSFHIRGVELCDALPVAISVSLDSTITQYHYPLNIPVHQPLKEESSISFLKVIGGGTHFIVGLRNGKISLYRNFEFEYIRQNFALPYFIPILAKCQSFQSYAGRLVSFPIILKNIYEVPLNRFPKDSSIAVLAVPAEHFGIYHNSNKILKFGWLDTISSNLRSIVSVDTFAIVYAYTLHPWGERKATFKINHIDFRGKKNIFWIFDTATVEIVEVCKPLTNIMKFELMPKVNFFADYNRNEGRIELKVETDSTIFCKFLLINIISGQVNVLLERECNPSETLMSLEARNIASGLYVVVLQTSFTNLAKKMILYK
ncbi:MAG: WD40 repeat domain-containing protein, partial [Candidatus Kapaibacteriota bacterium]